MTAKEKQSFIQELMAAMEKRMLKCVERMPEDWDGVELRQFIADTANHNTMPQLLKGKRKREYENAKMINNLF